MKFTLVECGKLPVDALCGDVKEYLTSYKRYEGDPLEEVKITTDISFRTERSVWCRPCDVKQLYLRGLDVYFNRCIYYSKVIDTQDRSYKPFIAIDYHHFSTKELLEHLGSKSLAKIIVITSSDYVMNNAMAYFRTVGKPPVGDSVGFRWLREYTIEEARYKCWSDRDIPAAFSHVSVLMNKIGTRTDTHIGFLIDGQVVDISSEGLRKARQRKKSVLSM